MSTTAAQTSRIERIARVRQLTASGEGLAIREDAGVSALMVAQAAGLPHITVRRYERGLRQPSGDAALRYLKVLDALAKFGHGR